MWTLYLRNKETGKLYKWQGCQFKSQEEALKYIINVAFSAEEFHHLYKNHKFLAYCTEHK